MRTILIFLCILISGCVNEISHTPGTGIMMSQIQIPRIFYQSTSHNYGINVQCPSGKISDCVGAVLGRGLAINRQSND